MFKLRKSLFAEQKCHKWYSWRINPNKNLHEATWTNHWSRLLAKALLLQINCTAIRDMLQTWTIFNQITHIYPISELGQNIVDYWTHLMLKTNTSYFTGSSQLNKRFLTPSEIYIHMAAYRQFLSFLFLSITSKIDKLYASPLLYDSEAASGTF